MRGGAARVACALLCVAVMTATPISAVSTDAARPRNLYGLPLADCALAGEPAHGLPPGSGDGHMCTYRPNDQGAHQVCVGELPDGFSTRTGQGPWSDEHTGFNWCICIWAYANFITQHDAPELPIQCDAIPEQVMDSSYSLERFRLGASRRFTAAIETLCHTCATQAPDAAAHHHLATSCAALKQAAVAMAPPDEL